MNSLPYSTMEFREELVRVRRARRRNTVLIVAADLAVIAGVAYYVLTGWVL